MPAETENATLEILKQIQIDIAEIKAYQRASASELFMPAVPESDEALYRALLEGEESGISDQKIPDILAELTGRNA